MESNSVGNSKIDKLILQMTLEEKIQLVHGMRADNYLGNQAGFIKGVRRFNIPDVFIADGESGVNTSWDATALPAKVGLASTFDTQTCFEYGEVIGREAKASGMHVVLTPRVNIVRDPVADILGSNGGNYQTYGEDSVLNGLLGAAEVQGIQKDNNAIANLKQMFGSSTGTAQGANDSIIDEQTMHEIYIRPFEAPIKAHVGSAMTNYNRVNGTWSYMYSDMNQKLLREHWGFDGFIIDDWHCLFEPESIMENVTLEMPGIDYYDEGSEKSVYGKALMKAIEDPNNPVSEEHLDRAVGYLLKTLQRFDMLDNPRIPGPVDNKNKELSIKTAREIATKIGVLLKNDDGILPIQPSEKLALIGPTARQVAMPVFKEASYGFPDRKTGTLDALREQMQTPVSFAVGNDLEGTVIPVKYLKPYGRSDRNGLTRTAAEFGDCGNHGKQTANLPVAIDSSAPIDETVFFTGNNALPSLPLKFGEETVVPYYLWAGRLCPEETGHYHISAQTGTPGVSEFEKNITTGREMEIVTSGNLYFKENEQSTYAEIGTGYRVLMNGGAAANSSVVPCLDGFNNVSGYVYMEAGKEYDFYFTACSIYKMPVEVRLTWVTPSMRRENVERAVKNAKSADKSVVFVWHKSPSATLELAEHQNELISAVAAANPNTIVVINSGDPIAMPWKDEVKAILEMWYPGQEGGFATADLLLGHANPSGKLPVTFPKRLEDTAVHDLAHPERKSGQCRIMGKDTKPVYTANFTEGVHMGYRHFDKNNISPLYEFGYGLSYTSFAYANLNVERCEGGLRIICSVSNTGKFTGAEIVQCYVHRSENTPEDVQASPKTLGAFARMSLEPGKSKTVELFVEEKSLCYYKVLRENNRIDDGEGWTLIKGERTISIGASSRDLRLSTKVNID